MKFTVINIARSAQRHCISMDRIRNVVGRKKGYRLPTQDEIREFCDNLWVVTDVARGKRRDRRPEKVLLITTDRTMGYLERSNPHWACRRLTDETWITRWDGCWVAVVQEEETD